jgi:hypothetical protein
MEGSLVAYKVFTNGSVLQASEVNDNLMKQAVATFSNAAARTAAITSPVEGQLTYLEDTNQFQSWNTSGWSSAFGLNFINSVNFSNASSVSLANGTFSSEFDNYLILGNFFGSGGGGGGVMSMRFRAGGTDNSSSNYTFTLEEAYSNGSASRVNGLSQTSIRNNFVDTTTQTMFMQVFSPAQSTNTVVHERLTRFTSASGNGIGYNEGFGGFFGDTVFDSATFLPAGQTISGSFFVYGYKRGI